MDALRPICMSITPTENPSPALRLSGAVGLNIVGKPSIHCRLRRLFYSASNESLCWLVLDDLNTVLTAHMRFLFSATLKKNNHQI